MTDIFDDPMPIGDLAVYACLQIRPSPRLGFGQTAPLFDDEIAEFYWSTDISTKEIVRAYELEVALSQVSAIAGPGFLCGVLCFRCKGTIIVHSRSEAKAKLDHYRWARSTNRGNAYLEEHREMHCEQCSNQLCAERERERELREMADREYRRNLRYMPYRDYLKTDHWQSVRKQALRRADYKCQLCNASKPLQVHHRTYERRGEEWPEDLIALCGGCHGEFHMKLKVEGFSRKVGSTDHSVTG
jgi:5-methylcytosine-specific restriction endonuclease McrA